MLITTIITDGLKLLLVASYFNLIAFILIQRCYKHNWESWWIWKRDSWSTRLRSIRSFFSGRHRTFWTMPTPLLSSYVNEAGMVREFVCADETLNLQNPCAWRAYKSKNLTSQYFLFYFGLSFKIKPFLISNFLVLMRWGLPI